MPVPEELSTLDRGARIMIRMPHGGALASVLRACFDAGVTAVPLGPKTGDRELAGLAERVRASAIVDGRDAEFRRTVHTPREDDPTNLAFIMFTSGSTGPQKGVMLSPAAVLGNAAKTAALHGIRPDRPHGTCLPLYHCNALVMSLIGTHLTGSPLVLADRFDPVRYFTELGAANARTASIVPALLGDLLDAAPPWPDALDYLITAAAPLTPDLARRFHRLYGPRLRQGYGLTEAVNFSFTMPHLDGAAYREQYVDRFAPVGLPLPETEFRLERGEVQLRTPDLMDGYWDDPATTAATLTPDGWLRTGDLGELRDGLLVLNGRSKERIDRGGEKYYPLDVERRWREAGLTGRFAAVGVREPTLGQEIALITSGGPVTQVRSLFAEAEVRPAVVQFGGFRATATGKPQRRAMGEGLAARRLSPARYENLLRHAARTARALLDEGGSGPAFLKDLAACTTEPPGGTEEIADAFEFVRTQGTALRALPDSVLAQWRTRILGCWPLTEYTALAAEIAGGRDVPLAFGSPAVFDGGLLTVVPHRPDVTTGQGTPWALSLLGTLLDGADGRPQPDRWEHLANQPADPATTVGFSLIRAGRHDLGGVLWTKTDS
ncbi:acyl-CoA synthetase (AMP-forming)/AMP-acid ligase II [Amycolatopsis sulphurea]|uniref:Acyl-CoA synthetase (AMP-forming)/AMP-acid ligase II n=1 Tax=Amycolatopsis sulphurea TaxID=76022 RepID=A0A2A9G2Z6_9PSEU|nr:class I adenylate-forming enzyme family protein [Amycolatopsis sulphurea]PFG57306.1 acyl-CoA synthetase (AMP-forming)/AMP-acid ligase II [Amycolatopsis sulphurea]